MAGLSRPSRFTKQTSSQGCRDARHKAGHDVERLGASSYSAASTAFLDLRGVLAVLAAARFFGLATFGAAAFLAAAASPPRAGRMRRALEPPPRSARASTSIAASSSEMVSGVLS